ncbi:MAG: Gfo/Idh/MocA family oxidoreductase [Chloroflexota bacterium]
MKPYRAAIIGTGGISFAHVEALQSQPDRVELVAASDVDEATLSGFCEKYGVAHGFTSAAEMLSAIQPDLVHIVTPPGTHCELVIESLKAGAWVYCEKPLCLSLAEFDRIAEAEAQTGRFVSTVFQWRFGSAGKHLKRLIESGDMGRPLLGVCNTLWYRTLEYYQRPWRGKWATEAGGAATGMGIHLTDLFLWLMGDWQDVRAIVGTLDHPIDVEDAAMALVRFASGAMGTITSSTVSPRQETNLRLDFQRATVSMSGLYSYRNANWQYSLFDGSTDQAALERWQTIEQDVASSHAAQLADLLDSMDANQRPAVSGGEARRIVEFLASMYKSAFTGETVARGSITPDDPFYHSMNGFGGLA